MTRDFLFAPFVLLAASSVNCDQHATRESLAPSSASPGPHASASPSPVLPGPVVVGVDGTRALTPGIFSDELAARISGPPLGKAPLESSGTMTVQCKGPGQAVSGSIYGVAWADSDFDLGATAHRWGGNTTSRYNPKLGNAWSTANDWFFENVAVDGWDKFVAKAADRGGRASITVPMLGWVAKDTRSCAFDTRRFPKQEKTDPYRAQCGNGKRPDGKTLLDPPKDPSAWQVRVTPEDVGAWVSRIKAADQKRGRRVVYEYILDNEPALWDSTHRDVHPEGTTYDELLEKTIAFGTAVRKADPDAVIAGPAEWGWPGYFFSGKDAKIGFKLKPDRRAHGDEPLLAWYLRKLAEHEKKTGVRVLDVLDVHLYPQGEGVQFGDGEGGDGGGNTDRATNELRLRTTRSLWDRNYRDESWIGQQDDGRVYLIPRMKELIAQNYPGLGFQIGEYNFGAEHHISGALALAEALGRFAVHGVSHAFYWTYPKPQKPAYWAFRAFRNYDGAGGHFLDTIVPSASPRGTSLYASRGDGGSSWVLIALNFNAEQPFDATLMLEGCAPPSALRAFVYTGSPEGLMPSAATLEGVRLRAKLPPSSITVLELR